MNVDARQRKYAHCTVYSYVTNSYCELEEGHDSAIPHRWKRVDACSGGTDRTICTGGYQCQALRHDLGCLNACGNESHSMGGCSLTSGHDWQHLKAQQELGGLNPPPETILDEANRIINGTRAGDYGENTTPGIAEGWNWYLDLRFPNGDVQLDGRDVAVMQMLLKIVRDTHKRKRDNPVDIAGYAELMEKEPNGSAH